MNDFIVKCPDCGSNKLWVTDENVASDNSGIDLYLECRVCRIDFIVDYRPKGYVDVD